MLTAAPYGRRERHRYQSPRSYHARKVATLTAENWYYDVELSNERGRLTLLRQGDSWYNEQGTLIASSDDIKALYLPASVP